MGEGVRGGAGARTARTAAGSVGTAGDAGVRTRKGYLILPDARDAKVLLRIHGTGWRLPEIVLDSAQPWGRATQAINQQVREALGLECTVLRCIESCEPFALTDRLEAFVIEGQQYTPERYAGFAREWKAMGAQVIGGCCGTGPEHIRAVGAAIRG